MTHDSFLDLLDDRVKATGYRIVRYGEQGEFPDGCVAAMIAGPNLGSGGMPFIVPADNREIWARRWCAALAAAFEAGRGFVFIDPEVVQ
jgi:hypothetical protein